MNHNQRKKHIIRDKSTIVDGTLIAVNKLPRIKGGAKIQSKMHAKLKIAKDPLSKIFLFLFLLSFFKKFHDQLIKLFIKFLYLFKSIKKICFQEAF